MSWLSQATLILDDADLRFYRRLLRSLTRQVRFLRVTANDTRDGVARLQARIALTYAALCMAKQVRHLRLDDSPPGQRIGASDFTRRRSHQPQSGGHYRNSPRFVASQPSLCGPQRAPAAALITPSTA